MAPQKLQIKRTSTPNSPPVGLSPGELSIEMADPHRLWVGVPTLLDATNRKLVGAVIINDAAPTVTSPGMLWWESDSGILWMWYQDVDGGQWVQTAGSSGVAGITIADAPPAGASPGSLWWESDTAILWIYYDDGDTQQWVQAAGSGGAPPVTAVDAYTKAESDAKYVELIGDTMSGALVLTPVPTLVLDGNGPVLWLDRRDATAASIISRLNTGAPQWSISMNDTAFSIGGAVANSMSIDHANGNTTFGVNVFANSYYFTTTAGGISPGGDYIGIYNTASIPGLLIGGAVDQATYYQNNRHLFRAADQSTTVLDMNATAASFGGAITANGHVQANTTLTVSSSFTVSGSSSLQALTCGNILTGGTLDQLAQSNLTQVAVSGALWGNGGRLISKSAVVNPSVAVLSANTGYCMYGAANNNCLFLGDSDGNGQPMFHQLRIGGDFLEYVSGSARKTGAGDWEDRSDARIKDVIGDYVSGLDAIKALRPVRFTFKGNDTTEAPEHRAQVDEANVRLPDPETTPVVPYGNSSHYLAAVEGREFIGLVAQEAETVMPEMVTQETAMIDGQPVTDMRILDPTALTYALINAVQELAAANEALTARIAALEGAA